MVLAQRKRTGLRIHRLRQLAEALVEQIREREGSGGNLTHRAKRGCEPFIEPIDARPEGLVPNNVGNHKAAGIGRCGFGPKHVEGILKASCERLVGTDRLHERAIRRSLPFEVGVEPHLLELLVCVVRLKLPEIRKCAELPVVRRQQQPAQQPLLFRGRRPGANA